MHLLALSAFVLLVAIPTALTDTVADPEAGRPWQLAGLAAFLALSVHWRMIAALTTWLRSPTCLLITGVMLVASVRATLTGSTMELGFALATLAVLLVMTATPDRHRSCLIAGLALTGFLAWACLTQPVDLVYRRIGTLHPNHAGAMALAAAMLVWLSGHRLRWVVVGFAATLMVAVSSRSAMLALAVFLGLIGARALVVRTPLAAMTIATAAVIAAGIAVVVAPESLARAVRSVTAIDDPFRGLDTGMTGRVELWSGFLPQFVENPWGYGYRQRDLYDGAHNGYLNAALEHGLAGVALLLAFLAVALAQAWRQPVLSAAIVALLARAFTEPNLINLGDPAGTTLLLALAWAVASAPERSSQPVATPEPVPA